MGHLDSQRSLPVMGAINEADPARAGAHKTGYSPTAKKLRLAPNHRVAILNAPPEYIALLSPGPAIRSDLQPSQTYDVVQLFVKNVEELRKFGAGAIHAVKPDGLLWITYPKGGETRGTTDLPATPWWTQRDVLGEVTSVTGYKPVALVSIDDNWTALRFKRV